MPQGRHTRSVRGVERGLRVHLLAPRIAGTTSRARGREAPTSRTGARAYRADRTETGVDRWTPCFTQRRPVDVSASIYARTHLRDERGVAQVWLDAVADADVGRNTSWWQRRPSTDGDSCL